MTWDEIIGNQQALYREALSDVEIAGQPEPPVHHPQDIQELARLWVF